MIANIASDDGLILPHRANPTGSNFRERQRFALNEMPKEIRQISKAKEQTDWVRAKSKEYRKKLNPHLFEQSTPEEPSA
jgi:hypothetical protein